MRIFEKSWKIAASVRDPLPNPHWPPQRLRETPGIVTFAYCYSFR